MHTSKSKQGRVFMRVAQEHTVTGPNAASKAVVGAKSTNGCSDEQFAFQTYEAMQVFHLYGNC